MTEIVFRISKRSDYSEVMRFIREVKEVESDCIINFQFAKGFFEPFDILLFTQFVIHIRQNIINGGICRITLSSDKEKVIQYIKNIGLSEFCKKNYKQSTTVDAISSITAMPIRRIDSEHLTEYVYRTLTYLKAFATNKDLTFLSLGLEETLNNANDHSESNIGAYVFCQYYPTYRKISVCVSDFGIGIVQKVKQYLNDEDFDEKDCLSWALQEMNSTKSTPQNAGKGFPNVLNFVLTNKSSIKITTNNIMYQLVANNGYQQRFSQNSIRNYIGTCVEFDILIDNLPEIEDYLIDDDLVF